MCLVPQPRQPPQLNRLLRCRFLALQLHIGLDGNSISVVTYADCVGLGIDDDLEGFHGGVALLVVSDIDEDLVEDLVEDGDEDLLFLCLAVNGFSVGSFD
jgi:hypothetical protein